MQIFSNSNSSKSLDPVRLGEYHFGYLLLRSMARECVGSSGWLNRDELEYSGREGRSRKGWKRDFDAGSSTQTMAGEGIMMGQLDLADRDERLRLSPSPP